MSPPPVGVANSISQNFQFDPLDTIEFARQGNFEMLQIFLNKALLAQSDVLKSVIAQQDHFQQIFYHAEGKLNTDFFNSDYKKQLYRFLATTKSPQYIIHFDEHENIDQLIHMIEALDKEAPAIFLENYFLQSGKINAEKNLKKYLALFTLSSNFGNAIYPVLDIPRIFHKNLEFTSEEGLEWCYQIINFFGNRRIPLLLHLIDATSSEQGRSNFTAVGQGYIPYDKIFAFIEKTRPLISGIVLEFEDKINPLTSRTYIYDAFQ